MSFREFQAFGRDCDNLGAELRDEALMGVRGRLYVGYWIQDRPGQKDVYTGKPLGRWGTMLDRTEVYDDNLEVVERALYRYALDTGYTTPGKQAMENDEFGDRMKEYERAGMPERFMRLVPIVARIDGRGFSKFTEGLRRPYDNRLSSLMIETTKYLVKETSALMGYTQSDEITLIWYSSSTDCRIFFDGKPAKMISTLAAMATAYFNHECASKLSAYYPKMPTFDCRVWPVPNKTEGANAFLWRERDATKNSISMAARSVYEHKELHGKDGKEMQEMLFQKGINWNDYPPFFKRGTFVRVETETRAFTLRELANLPEKHHAHTNPNLKFERSEVRELHMPPFDKVQNREEVIFEGDRPKIYETVQEEEDRKTFEKLGVLPKEG